MNVLVGLVGGEGGVAGIGDGRGAGWPISIVQHLDCQQPVERPWGFVPPTEHVGEQRRSPAVVDFLGKQMKQNFRMSQERVMCEDEVFGI